MIKIKNEIENEENFKQDIQNEYMQAPLSTQETSQFTVNQQRSTFPQTQTQSSNIDPSHTIKDAAYYMNKKTIMSTKITTISHLF